MKHIKSGVSVKFVKRRLPLDGLPSVRFAEPEREENE